MRWHALHAKLVRSTATLSFHRQFETVRRASVRLRRFPDPAALLDHLHAPGGDAAARNLILRDLVAAAQAEQGGSAATLLVLALWPGLDAVHTRLRRHHRSCPQEIAAEIVGRVSVAIGSLDLARVSWIAATVLRNLERDIRRARRAGWAETALTVQISDEIAADAYHPGYSCQTSSAALIRRDLRRLLGDDADLLLSVAVLGETQQAAGARVGLGSEAARKRHRRARQRLEARLAEIA